MSDRLLKSLLIVLAVLVAAWAAVRFLGGDRDEPQSAPFSLGSSATLTFDSVIIASSEDTLRLLRAGEVWTVNGYEALAETGASLKRALEQGNVGPLVSRNPENHERLGVSESAARQMTFYSGGALQLKLFIGRRGRAYDQAYVRRDDEDETYTLRGSLISLASRGVDDWRDKIIVEFDRGMVERVELDYPGESLAVNREDAGWRIEPSGAAADSGEVSNMLTLLAGLRAIGFAADAVADTLSWEPPTGRVRIVGFGGAELGDLVFLDRGDVGAYVRWAGSPVVYTISTHIANQILKHEEHLVRDTEG